MTYIPDETLARMHEAAEGVTKDLLAELIAARKALVVAQRVASLGPILKTNIHVMELEGCPRQEMYMSIIHKKPDGSGRIGSVWDLGEFDKDLSELATLTLSEDDLMEMNAVGLLSVFGPTLSKPVVP